jgi:two-component system, sensor histidine kinase
MADSIFSFTEDKFNKLFPFYILIDNNLNVISYGASIKKLFPLRQGRSFFANFKVTRPKLEEETFDSLSSLQDQLVIIDHRLYEGIPMKGQLEVFEGNKLLYIGTPWFDSIGKIKGNNLTINDFAIHDSVVDLLHIVQTKEIANNDIKELLGTYNKQSKTLKQREVELLETSNRMTQMIANLQNGVLVEDENRNIVLTNETFCRLFAIPATPEQMIGANCANFAEQSKDLFKDPVLFLEELEQLLCAKEKKLNYTMELADGRFLSRDYIPVFFGGVYKGHLWKYTDVTESKLVEHKLESQKKFYEQILNEIPADIAVFDKDHRYLFVNPVGIK